jgi:hypothetical protein
MIHQCKRRACPIGLFNTRRLAPDYEKVDVVDLLGGDLDDDYSSHDVGHGGGSSVDRRLVGVLTSCGSGCGSQAAQATAIAASEAAFLLDFSGAGCSNEQRR